jgi:hypothetical protein
MDANFWIGHIWAVRTDYRLTTDDTDGHGWRIIYRETARTLDERKLAAISGFRNDRPKMNAGKHSLQK